MGEWWTYLVSGLSTAVPVVVTAWALYRRQRRKDADADIKVKREQAAIDLDGSREHQALSQQGESYQIQQIKALMRERQKIHEADKEEQLRLIGNAEKRLDACEKDRVWIRVILDRFIRSNRQRADFDTEQEQDFFRPVEVWEKAQDDKRVEEAKKREDDGGD